MPSGENEKKPDEEVPISHLRRKQDKNKAEVPREVEDPEKPGGAEDAEVPREVDVDSGGEGLGAEEDEKCDSTWRRIRDAGEDISSIYSLHIPRDFEPMLWAMSFFLFLAVFIAYIYFMDRVSPWILIPLLSIPVIFWLAFTFAAYWTETRAFYLIKRTLSYDVIQSLRGYRQYVIRRKER